ncbi:DALR anticodon-binding domain-containing protein, partial [Streptomyces sp. NPDC058953]|uniref:DALR anticodon-binding domain-containing protein n=1 Tax=Streptomyces sp. NPDC058953 TaxID=3346676 RepID=UPI0036887031
PRAPPPPPRRPRAHRAAGPGGGGRARAARRETPVERGGRAVVWSGTVELLRRIEGYGTESGTPPVADHEDTADALGTDATRWAFLSAAAHDPARPGPRLLRQHESNPLFTVRYAHARAHALSRNAAALGFTAAVEPYGTGAGEEKNAARGVERWVADWPAAIGSAARLHAPDRIARHLEGTADALLGFQPAVLPVGGAKPLAAHRSRLALAEAAGAVLAGGLTLLGISAPDHL